MSPSPDATAPYYASPSLHQVDLDHSSASDGFTEVTEAIEKVFFYRK